MRPIPILALSAVLAVLVGCGGSSNPSDDGPTERLDRSELSPEAQKSYDRLREEAIEDATKNKPFKP